MPIKIYGAQYGVDARGRSTVGWGVMFYSGAADPNESTITTTLEIVIQISTSNVELDGLTITSDYAGSLVI